MEIAEPQPGDEVVDIDGGRVIVDAKAVLYLLGTRMDVKTDNFSSTFVFENPKSDLGLRLRRKRRPEAGGTGCQPPERAIAVFYGSLTLKLRNEVLRRILKSLFNIRRPSYGTLVVLE